MRTLKEKFSYNTYDYELVKRNDTSAIYRQLSEGRTVAYEAIAIIYRKEQLIHGKIIEEGEYYPGNSQWGSNAFTYHELEDAERKYEEFTKLKESKKV